MQNKLLSRLKNSMKQEKLRSNLNKITRYLFGIYDPASEFEHPAREAAGREIPAVLSQKLTIRRRTAMFHSQRLTMQKTRTHTHSTELAASLPVDEHLGYFIKNISEEMQRPFEINADDVTDPSTSSGSYSHSELIKHPVNTAIDPSTCMQKLGGTLVQTIARVYKRTGLRCPTPATDTLNTSFAGCSGDSRILVLDVNNTITEIRPQEKHVKKLSTDSK